MTNNTHAKYILRDRVSFIDIFPIYKFETHPIEDLWQSITKWIQKSFFGSNATVTRLRNRRILLILQLLAF